VSENFTNEAVDIESNGDWVSVCTGFGVGVARINSSDFPTMTRHLDRCQRMAYGPSLPGGEQVLYVTHHGDSWVPTPHLTTLTLGVAVVQQERKLESDVLYEGMAYRDGFLYVASHGSGLRTYEVDLETGVPTFVHALTGFDNAIKLDIVDDLAFVADESSIHVVSLAESAAPARLSTVDTFAKPRDIDVHADRVYVALGSLGLQVFDRAGPVLTPRDVVVMAGSVQAVSATDDMVATANWQSVVILDAPTLVQVGSERTVAFFEQALGVATVGNDVFVAEWGGMHQLRYQPGFVAPDAYVSDQLLSFSGSDAGYLSTKLRNRGPLDLLITELGVSVPGVSVDASGFTLHPGESRFLELTYAPQPDAGTGHLLITSNDPDVFDMHYEVPMTASSTDRLDVGDELGEAFAFLDPTGGGNLDNLRGKVVVLAYFALF
jgi:hypothetical protein